MEEAVDNSEFNHWAFCIPGFAFLTLMLALILLDSGPVLAPLYVIIITYTHTLVPFPSLPDTLTPQKDYIYNTVRHTKYQHSFWEHTCFSCLEQTEFPPDSEFWTSSGWEGRVSRGPAICQSAVSFLGQEVHSWVQNVCWRTRGHIWSKQLMLCLFR